MELKNDLVIESITAFVSVDKDGNEGIIGQLVGSHWMPFVCADEARVQSLLPLAIEFASYYNIDMKILRFSQREDVTEKYVDW